MMASLHTRHCLRDQIIITIPREPPGAQVVVLETGHTSLFLGNEPSWNDSILGVNAVMLYWTSTDLHKPMNSKLALLTTSLPSSWNTERWSANKNITVLTVIPNLCHLFLKSKVWSLSWHQTWLAAWKHDLFFPYMCVSLQGRIHSIWDMSVLILLGFCCTFNTQREVYVTNPCLHASLSHNNW